MNTGAEWNRIAGSDEVKENFPIVRKIGDSELLLVRRKGKVCACGNTCPHYGAPLNEGVLHGDVITCPWHNSQFDVTSGKMLSPPALENLPVYEVREEKGDVLVGRKDPQRIMMPPGEDARVFAVIGAGAAAISAAETLRREGFSGTVTLITEEDSPPYDRPTLSKGYAAGKAGNDALPLHPPEYYERLHITLLTRHRVRRIDPDAHKVVFESGDTLSYNKLLLASGGIPNRLNVPGAGLEKILTLRSWSDAQKLVSEVDVAKKIVLIGASFISMELASGFSARGKDVSVVAPDRIPFAAVLGEEVGRRLLAMHEEKGVKFYLERKVKEFRGASVVESVVLDDGSSLSADLVVAGIGVKPRVEYLEGTRLVRDGAVPVDSHLRTSLKDIYAAGDIAVVPSQRLGKGVRIEHWAVAERQGQHAALSMAGVIQDYDELPFFWTMQQGSSLRYVGYAPDFDSVLFRGDVGSGSFLAGYYHDNELRAAATIGMSPEIMALGELIKWRVPVDVSYFVDEDFDLVSFMKEHAGKRGAE